MNSKKTGELADVSTDLAQSVRLGLQSEAEGIRLFAARLVRKYRQSVPGLSQQIDEYLRAAPAVSPMRRKSLAEPAPKASPDNVAAQEDDLALLRVDNSNARAPVLDDHVNAAVHQLLTERRQSKKLKSAGLDPIRSAIFVGPPGVGKTMTAKWIAAELSLPLFVLDLTAIMSSYLGRTGSNLRAVLDYAKTTPSVLLLDEIDAIAKRRGDLSDVGELKRLVTVILQEIDAWPSSSLLLAATNHPELIDPALWRRFDSTLEFPRPGKALILETVERLLGNDAKQFTRWLPILAILFEGGSYSDIDRTMRQFRKAITLGSASPMQLIEDYVLRHSLSLDRSSRLEMARQLVNKTNFSQHKICDVTGVARGTIRKYQKEQSEHGD